jgi:hypothetical protein
MRGIEADKINEKDMAFISISTPLPRLTPRLQDFVSPHCARLEAATKNGRPVIVKAPELAPYRKRMTLNTA